MKRDIIHSLILQGGRSDIKALKKYCFKIFVESDKFEDALLEVAT